MANNLITAEIKVLTPQLIMELLENGYTRFQDENTFEKESIQNYLVEHFPNIFTSLNVKNQITVMFSREPLKGKRTQKVIRQAFNWGMTNNVEVIEEVEGEEENPVNLVTSPDVSKEDIEKNWANASQPDTVPIEYKEEEELEYELVEDEDSGKMPWDM